MVQASAFPKGDPRLQSACRRFHICSREGEGFDDDEWGSPELAKALEAKSVELELKESDKKQVSVTVISADEWAAAVKKTGG